MKTHYQTQEITMDLGKKKKSLHQFKIQFSRSFVIIKSLAEFQLSKKHLLANYLLFIRLNILGLGHAESFYYEPGLVCLQKSCETDSLVDIPSLKDVSIA